MKIQDTLTERKLDFVPPTRPVRLYVCGITPYDTTHLGHARTYVFFDVVRRYLRFKGHQVQYVQNITDIDDPLFERARSLGTSYHSLAQTYIRQYDQDMSALNVLPADDYPRVSASIPEIARMVQLLLERDHAYVRDGRVYFRVASFPGYGNLSHLAPVEMIELGREHGEDPDDPRKENRLDFILWKPSRPDEPSWPSPWGPGRPGWHIECSTFALEHLGNPVDIHGGGDDLIYPHHENEIAQSESVTGATPFARYWMHVGMVRLGGEKMSKSLGNMVFVRDLLGSFTADALRLYVLSHPYRAAMDYEDRALDEWSAVAQRLDQAATEEEIGHPRAEVDRWTTEFMRAMDDDFDIRSAIAALLGLADLQRSSDTALRGAAARELRRLSEVLGLSLG
ncbi:MAG: cysteine--tRNA ligase [Chloroflexota bacterium]|nr:MAG: cysteine--tRNA ligase [Chloroflexota bacterium]